MNASPQEQRSFNALIPALAFIVIGGILLLRNLDVLEVGHNWWAFFFLIPIANSVVNFRRHRQVSQGKFSAEMRNTLIGLLSMSFIMCVFLFDWNWGAIWPVFLILGGLSILLSSKLE
ncbi:MAG: LiaF transmembrane domain-containing protein [bacterium]